MVVLMLAVALQAQVAQGVDSALQAAIRAGRHRVTLADGRLGGPGGELLRREVAGAQFVLVGEEHGVAEIPAVVGALVRDAAGAGYRHFGIEVGAQLAREMNRMAMGPGAVDRIAAFCREHPPGIPFYALREEAELAAAAVAAMGNRPDVLWGLDYDIIADRWLLPGLRAAVPTAEGRAAVDAVIADADQRYARAMEQKDPRLIMMFGGPDSTFPALRRAVGPAPGSEADLMLELLEETLAINRLFLTGRNYESNDRRGRFTKRQLGRALAAARAGGELPRAIFKFGASHMMRGQTFTNIFDVGGTLAELAALEGRPTFHLWVTGGPGSRRAQVDPTVFKYVPVPGDLDRTASLAPLRAEAPAGEWTLFDLRPLRSRARELRLAPALSQVVFGFDVVLILGGSSPSTPLVP